MFSNCPECGNWDHIPCSLSFFCFVLSHEQLLRALAGIPLAQPRASSSSGGWLFLQGWAVSPFLFGDSGVLCILSCKPRSAEQQNSLQLQMCHQNSNLCPCEAPTARTLQGAELKNVPTPGTQPGALPKLSLLCHLLPVQCSKCS